LPIDCGDGIACTDDACDEVNDACLNTPDNGTCDDGQYCNGVETCDLNDCDEINDTCVYTPDGNNCPDDGLFCNGDEFCHPQNDCSSRGDPCLNGTVCDEDAGFCGPPPSCGDGIVDQGEDCDDGNTASGDCCSVDCQFESGGSSCSDEQYCNGEETCDGIGNCQPGVAVDCSDGVACTVDACDEVNNVCVNTLNDNNCPDDGLFCTGQEICDPVNGCLSLGNPCLPEENCDEASNQCVVSPECSLDVDCDDGLFCNGDELCDADGMCQPGTGPCPPEETCNEETDQCVAVEVDLDIAGLRATKGVRLKRVKDVVLKLVVQNNGRQDAAHRRATITGVQNGEEVYYETVPVNDPVGKGRTSWPFPSYRPTDEGTIEWTATIDDDDLDDDTKTVRTIVLP
jgi:cysteine-rich repeat protein